MSYMTVAQFAQTWGLGFLVLMFLAAVAYALWPGNRSKFERAARMPLSDETPSPGNNNDAKE
jgi:cytochrome c oxidase cbb3-type subunit 4